MISIIKILAGLSKTLQNRINDIKTFSTCEQCEEEYRIRYKYRPYLECNDIEFCDECIKKIALDYVYLRKIEKHLENAIEMYSYLEIVCNDKFNMIKKILDDVIKNREEKGKWLSEYSYNYAMGLDKVSAYYECDDNIVYIKSCSDKGELLNSIDYIDTIKSDNIKYDSDCKNIELRFEDYCKRPYYFSNEGSYHWIVPKGMHIILDKYYNGDFRNSEIDFR